MRGNRSTGTKPERRLGRALWGAGVRYRKNCRGVFGHPDFAIKKYRLAVFVDGEFWHGRNWETTPPHFATNPEFWRAKIERNRRRDVEVNARLVQQGWTVMRFWETDVMRRPGECLLKILAYVAQFTSASAPAYLPVDLDGLATPSPSPADFMRSTPGKTAYPPSDGPLLEAAEPSAPYSGPGEN